MNLISRADAGQKIRQHWLGTYTRERLLATTEPEWERMHNYEIEGLLEETFGDEWCINEWCPFDGVFSRWRDLAPESVIEERVAEIQSNTETIRLRGLNPEYLIAHLRKR